MAEKSAPGQHELDAIRQFDTCRIANAIESLGVRLRNEGFTRPGLKSLCGYSRSAIGFAVTARFKSSDAPFIGGAYTDRTDWWEHVVSQPFPRIAAFEDLDDTPGRGSFIGEVHAEILRALGCVGAVTNGSVRDLPAVRRMQFPLFARSTSVSHAYVHLIDYGGTVRILGLSISPGDLIYADCHGVVSIPHDIAAQLPEIAARQQQNERRIIDLCRSDRFSIERLRAEVQAKS
jgi:4-hydroxy-4-methyl-2-oxoglutarate aldolase